MVSVFAIFATLSMLEMKMMGVGLAAAILDRRDADPAGDAAGRPGAARRARLVAGPPGSDRGARSSTEDDAGAGAEPELASAR